MSYLLTFSPLVNLPSFVVDSIGMLCADVLAGIAYSRYGCKVLMFGLVGVTLSAILSAAPSYYALVVAQWLFGFFQVCLSTLEHNNNMQG